MKFNIKMMVFLGVFVAIGLMFIVKPRFVMAVDCYCNVAWCSASSLCPAPYATSGDYVWWGKSFVGPGCNDASICYNEYTGNSGACGGSVCSTAGAYGSYPTSDFMNCVVSCGGGGGGGGNDWTECPQGGLCAADCPGQQGNGHCAISTADWCCVDIIPPDPYQGNLDDTNCDSVWGWVCNRDTPDVSLGVNLFVDGEFIDVGTANLQGGDAEAIKGICGGTSLQHRFAFDISGEPFTYINGDHEVNVATTDGGWDDDGGIWFNYVPLNCPNCSPGTFANDSCGWNNSCNSNQMRQTKTDSPANCSPPSEQCVMNAACRPPVCQSSSISCSSLTDLSNPITMTITGSNLDTSIAYFELAFYNPDNLEGPGNPRGIYFSGGTQYIRLCNANSGGENCTISADKKSATFTVTYAEMNRPDLNWGGNKPTNIQINGYFGLADSGFSQGNATCVKQFNVYASSGTCVPACGQAADACGGVCSNADNGAPSTPTCTSIAASTDSTPAINWTSGGIPPADTWFYKIDGGAAVADSNLTASPAVTCGSHTWTAKARNTTCGIDDSGWTAPANACSLCRQCTPGAPTLVGPANGTQVRVGQATSLSWAGTGWGTGCPNVNNYQMCVMSGATCDLKNWVNDPDTASPYGGWTPAAADPSVTWKVRANNGSLTAESTTRTVCVEGFDNGASFSYVSNWGAWSVCGDNHTRSGTRTCTETCGVDDCNAFMAIAANCPTGNCNYIGGTQTKTEDCIGTITGTFFDASDLSSCDLSSNPAKYSEVDFGITGTWLVITSPIATNLSGVYTVSVYASATRPAEYTYNYDAFIATKRVAGVKFPVCQSIGATVTTQGQVVTKDTGFWRVYDGWWQVTGGSVYAKSGIKSYVPASLPPLPPLFVPINQRLILPDANGRIGMLSYGVAWGGAELGTNPDVRVSDNLWRIQSLYDGLRYDYNYFNTRMDVFASTAWNGGAITYADGGLGYQIFKRTGNVTFNYSGPTGTQKVILLVDGNVTINNDVTVPVGAFLGVIAKGNITFNRTVANAEGWFVAENISVPCKDTALPLGICDTDDVQFVGEGSFVGWTGIDLKRDRDVLNNTAPSEKFTYRPDMFNNAPTPMKVYTKTFSPFIP